MKTKTLYLYTDGSANNRSSDRCGGWAFVVTDGNKILKIGRDGTRDTTNNRMELLPVINGLMGLKTMDLTNVACCQILSDSKYVIETLEQGASRLDWWKQTGWTTSTGDKVKNKDLWEEVDSTLNEIKKIVKLRFYWVKGHSTNKFNNIVDRLAGKERKIIEYGNC